MKNQTYIYCVLDKSGSMGPTINDSIGGFNHFLQEQKDLKQDCLMSIKLFDTDLKQIVEHKNLEYVEPLNSLSYVPHGGTAMYDGIGSSIDELGKYLSKLKEEDRPEKVLFVILTDGEENASRKYNSSKIQEMIKTQREVYNWEFIFLAANQDALKVAEDISISKGNSMNFAATGQSIKAVYASMSDTTKMFRSKVSGSSANDSLFADAGYDNTKVAN